MTEEAPPARRPGPWDRLEPAVPATAAGAPAGRPPAQSLLMAVVSTGLLAGYIAWQMGWQWALAGVVGVFVHEYGHVLAMNALGCGPARIHIIPFLGGAAVPARPWSTDFKGVLISLAGPVFGLVATLPFLVAADLTHDDRWTGAALFVVIINLVNLAPAPPLDGSKALGPALAKVHPMLERVAMVLVGAAAVLWALHRGSYLFAIFVGLGTFAALRRPTLRVQALPLTGREWAASVALYALAAGACVAMVFYTAAGDGAVQLMRLVGLR
jgi:hypothetical protein